MQTRVLLAALISIWLSAAAEGRADSSSWLGVSAPRSCEIAAAEMAERVRDNIVGERAADLRASVLIEEFGAGFRVTLLTLGAAQPPGEKVISAPSCDEAVEAAVLVLALALSEPVTDPLNRGPAKGPLSAEAAMASPNQESARGEAGEWAEPALPAPTDAPAVFSLSRARVDPQRDGAMSHDVHASSNGSRLSLATGVDGAMFHALSPYAALGFARAFSVFELRGVMRYGFPLTEVSDEDGQSERVRREFGALALALCRGFGARWQLATCVGAEAGVVRRERELHMAGGVDLDEDRARVRLAGTLGVFVTHRASLIQPEFELSSAAVAFGRNADSPWLGLRVAVGAATHF